jgi:hypothetical protein
MGRTGVGQNRSAATVGHGGSKRREGSKTLSGDKFGIVQPATEPAEP